MQLNTLCKFALLFFAAGLVNSDDPKCEPYVKKPKQSVFQMLQTPRSIKIPREETKFYLFTRENQNCFQEINRITMKESFLNPNWHTRIIIHGWMNNAFSGVNRLIKDAYLTKGDFNVIVVDWGNLAKDINYDRASKLVDEIGELIAEFIIGLHEEINIKYNDIYLIGHSLGAQIAGVVGVGLSPEKINTLFALDPAEPNFKSYENDSRISISSANYVESIHTDMGLLGVKYAVGHASFFPNYGQNQKGCGFLKKCSHSRAFKYFAESINSDIGFWGIKCNSIEEIRKMRCRDSAERVLMGGEPAKPKIGYYYVPTNKHEPYAKGSNITL